MVDPAREVTVGDRTVCKEGEILNLTAAEATEVIPPREDPLLAEAIVNDLDELLEAADLGGASIKRFQPEPAEKLARWIVSLGPLLFSLGILGIFIELKTPGFGVPGIGGIVCLMIYFFGHYVAGLAGWEDLTLVVVGIVLLGLEIFVIPGFGVPGLLGILCIIAGTIMGMIPYLPEVPENMPDITSTGLAEYLEVALLRFLIIVVCAGIGGYILAKLLPKTRPYRKLVLDTSLSQESGYSSSDASYKDYLGQTGEAKTSLRPAGIATVGGHRLDVVTSGEMIGKGAPIRVIDVQGARIVVEAAPEEEIS